MSNSEYVQTTIGEADNFVLVFAFTILTGWLFLLAKCMDFYSQQKVAIAEGATDVKPIDSRYLLFFFFTNSCLITFLVFSLPLRLEGIVNRMFQRCLDDGQYKQAIGIAIETRRMDVFRRAILESVGCLSREYFVKYAFH